jgi:pimeloyl-ACP methyl ester carboxylesterase
MLSPLYERFLGRKRLRFPYLARPIPAEAYDALAAKPGWSKAALDVGPGVKLRGLLRPPKTESAPWVLFYPGNDESQLERGQAFLTRLGEQEDLGLAVFAYRGYDASDGTTEHAVMRLDAPKILDGLCATKRVSPERVHVAGFSIGGHFAVHAVAAATRASRRPATLTLLASVDDIVMLHPSPWQRLSRGEDYQTRPFIADISAPVLILQGAADEALGGAGQGRDLAQAFGARARYVELPGVEHVPLLENATALDTLRSFIHEHAPR